MATPPATDWAGWDEGALPLARPGEGGFAAHYRQLRDEVLDFIENGSGEAAPTLAPEGWWARSRLAPAVMTETSPDAQAFLAQIAPHAEAAGERLGVAPELVAAHAALESGWGRRPLQTADGRSSHNLFGLKAGALWRGDTVRAATHEVVAGQRVPASETFRAYPDLASAFADYARTLAGNPRYRGALGAGHDALAFARGLAAGGYATDPDYAAKLAGVAAKLTLRQGAARL